MQAEFGNCYLAERAGTRVVKTVLYHCKSSVEPGYGQQDDGTIGMRRFD